jgi:hypothetical protein
MLLGEKRINVNAGVTPDVKKKTADDRIRRTERVHEFVVPS